MKSTAMDHLAALATNLAGRLHPETVLRINEPMARRTTLRVGGPADLYLEPVSENELSLVLDFAREQSLPVMLLGRGSNLLVRDGGIRGVVVCLAHPSFSRIEWNDGRFICGAGARLRNLAFDSKKYSVTGFEFLEGIPGTIGGALRMNAGAMGGWIFERVKTVRHMDFAGAVHESEPGKMGVEYRSCALLKKQIALSATLEGSPGNNTEIAQKLSECSSKRWSSQPAAPSAGCIFKNPLTTPAGKLVDELGLKNHRIGGAMVSQEHGNFIVNDANATAADVLSLIALIKERALKQRGIELRTEVEIVGEDRE